MVLKNLLRRKGRTLLTVLGISVGVATIIGLGALADGLESGYQNMLSGSQADLVLSQPDSFDISYSSVDEAIGDELNHMPEISAVSGFLQGFVQTEGIPYFFIFGYPEESFILSRFQIISGTSLASRDAKLARGKPILLGSSAAETLDKAPGDTIRITDSVYRIVGIYQTGEGFEDSGAVLNLSEAQELLGKPRQVSLYYIQLNDPALQDRFARRVERLWPDLSLSSTNDYADKQLLGDFLRGYVWGIAGMAIVIGGVGMMNAQLMAVFERTREIGVLRAVGWSGRRILWMIFSEALLVCLIGGILGVGLGWLLVLIISGAAGIFGTSAANIRPSLLIQAFSVVLILGIVGGIYPAWRAARLQPIEALRYEGGSGGGKVRRLPIGGMAVQSLWQRTIRTFLTLGAIGLTVGAIMALESIIRNATDTLTDMALGADVEIMIRQADIADTSLSAMDERIGDKIAALQEVDNVSGMVFTAVALPDNGGFFVMQGYAPNSYAMRRFNIADGKSLTSNHQILLGRVMSEALKKGVGDTIELGGSRFRIVGVYETGAGWEELGGVVTLRDAQTFTGRPRKVTMYMVKVKNASQAEEVMEKINEQMPGIHAALSGEFVEQMPDMRASNGLMAGISFLAILVGGLGVLNTMLMSVLERTREIGVLRALGWRRLSVLGLIVREALLLGLLGGGVGIGIAFGLAYLMRLIPMIGQAFVPVWPIDLFVRAISVALILGLLGGLYPAYRATRLSPVEALRYE